MPLVSLNLIGTLDSRHKLLEEEVGIVVARHIEITIPVIMRIRIACIRHHNDHGTTFTGSYQLIDHILHMPGISPVQMRSIESVKKVDYGIVVRSSSIEPFRKVDIV